MRVIVSLCTKNAYNLFDDINFEVFRFKTLYRQVQSSSRLKFGYTLIWDTSVGAPVNDATFQATTLQ